MARMTRIIVRIEQKTAGHVEIAVVNQSTIDLDKRVPVPAVKQRYAVQWDAGALVMQHIANCESP